MRETCTSDSAHCPPQSPKLEDQVVMSYQSADLMIACSHPEGPFTYRQYAQQASSQLPQTGSTAGTLPLSAPYSAASYRPAAPVPTPPPRSDACRQAHFQSVRAFPAPPLASEERSSAA